MVKTPFRKPVLAVELEESGKLSRREEEIAQEIERLKKRLNELEGPVGKQQAESGRSHRPQSNIKCFKCRNKVILHGNAKGDRSRAMIPRLSRTQEERGKLVKVREKMAGAR